MWYKIAAKSNKISLTAGYIYLFISHSWYVLTYPTAGYVYPFIPHIWLQLVCPYVATAVLLYPHSSLQLSFYTPTAGHSRTVLEWLQLSFYTPTADYIWPFWLYSWLLLSLHGCSCSLLYPHIWLQLVWHYAATAVLLCLTAGYISTFVAQVATAALTWLRLSFYAPQLIFVLCPHR